MYHALSNSSREEQPNFILWGYTWVPFFFMLSGFVLFFSKAQQDGGSERLAREFGFAGKGAAWIWLWKRWISMYPLFVLSIVLGLWGVPEWSHPDGMWIALVNILLMLQAWAWDLSCTDRTTLCAYSVWNEPAWFVSALFFCWLVFPFAYRQLHRMQICSCMLLGSVLYALSFWELVVWPNLSAEQLRYSEQIGTIIARNPIANLNKFLIGAVLARLILLRCHVAASPSGDGRVLQLQRLPFVVAHAGSPAAVALVACFCSYNPDTTQGREAIIVGLYGTLICSLAAGRDPLARVLQWPAFAWWGRLSYAIYILHNAVLSYTNQLTADRNYAIDQGPRDRAFVPIVMVVALLGHYGIERPAASFYKAPPAWLCSGLCRRVPHYAAEQSERMASIATVTTGDSHASLAMRV